MFLMAEPAGAVTSGRTEIQPASHRLLVYYLVHQMGAVTAARGRMEPDDGNQIHIAPQHAFILHPVGDVEGETSRGNQ